jgi:hypothetical protein
MELLTLSTGILLPWLLGVIWLAAIEQHLRPGGRPCRLRQAGYGFFLGYAILTLAVMASHGWMGGVSWPWLMVFLFLLAGLGGFVLYRAQKPMPAVNGDAPDPIGTGQRILLGALVVWAGLHLLFAAIEILNQPVYPWDAWQSWVYRSKAWFLSGGTAEFVNSSSWARSASPETYALSGHNYPPLATVLPYWAALALGRWSETLVNLPVLLVGMAIGLALYGQCREIGMGQLISLVGAYLLLSIPLFGTHLALAGYADIWMSGYAGLGFVALIRGAAKGQRFQSALGLLMIALAMLVKNEGVVWFLAALLMLALIACRWRTVSLAALACLALGSLAWLLDVKYAEIPILGGFGIIDNQFEIPFVGRFTVEVHNVWQAYWDNFFTMGSWNLLWLLVAACLLLALFGKKPLTVPSVRASVVFIVIFAASQALIFGFTDQGVWADTYTAINRLPLHFVPALIFAALNIVHQRLALVSSAPSITAADHG